MKNKIEKFSINKTQFMLELFAMPIDYHITVGEMKELNDCIIEEAASRGLTLIEKDVVSFLRRQWSIAQTDHLVQYQIIKTSIEGIFEKEQGMMKVISTLRRNIRRLVKRRGKKATKQYLRQLIKDFPPYSSIFEDALREIK